MCMRIIRCTVNGSNSLSHHFNFIKLVVVVVGGGGCKYFENNFRCSLSVALIFVRRCSFIKWINATLGGKLTVHHIYRRWFGCFKNLQFWFISFIKTGFYRSENFKTLSLLQFPSELFKTYAAFFISLILTSVPFGMFKIFRMQILTDFVVVLLDTEPTWKWNVVYCPESCPISFKPLVKFFMSINQSFVQSTYFIASFHNCAHCANS